jgi:hypothetical protein
MRIIFAAIMRGCTNILVLTVPLMALMETEKYIEVALRIDPANTTFPGEDRVSSGCSDGSMVATVAGLKSTVRPILLDVSAPEYMRRRLATTSLILRIASAPVSQSSWNAIRI